MGPMPNAPERTSLRFQPFPASPRLRAARALYTLALVLLPFCLIATPLGLLPAAVCTLLAVLLAPDRIWSARLDAGRPLLWMLLAVALVALVVSTSTLIHHDRWSEAGNRGRVLVMPLAMLLVIGLAPPRAALWSGAVLGLFGACAVALVQLWQGVARSDGWINAITFGDLTVLLMGLVVFLRPSGRLLLTIAATCAGLVTVVLSGTRGAWPAAVLVLVIALISRANGGKARRWEFLALAGLAVVALAALLPHVSERVEELRGDIQRYAVGDADSSSGARIELIGMAVDELQRQPWTGVGVGHFERVVLASPECQPPEPLSWCDLDHAHSDFPEWGATMGIPGIVALLALYGVPAWLFVRQLRMRPFPRRSRSAALAGLMTVVSFVLCGLSQSMWAHQLSGGAYLTLVGILLGFSLREDPRKG
ncbi:O-antigen ligase family protein [Pseudoxanthomonas winnipegensis]|uniref:O-antigen ligase family protein n=2 Tax=Pseudoxanthomonas winnipegensis TaxID=2480810 RepID=A0A4Q8M4B8_9GAMM|nr:O-antigen ligase family protein [Pseudoxanthomonas winnipegensis]